MKRCTLFIVLKTVLLILPKLMYRCNPNKNLKRFLVDINKLFLNVMWKCTESTGIKTFEKIESLILPGFKTYYKCIIIKALCYCCNDR